MQFHRLWHWYRHSYNCISKCCCIYYWLIALFHREHVVLVIFWKRVFLLQGPFLIVEGCPMGPFAMKAGLVRLQIRFCYPYNVFSYSAALYFAYINEWLLFTSVGKNNILRDSVEVGAKYVLLMPNSCLKEECTLSVCLPSTLSLIPLTVASLLYHLAF